MAMLSNVAERAKDPEFFLRLAAWLYKLPRNDWTDWEWDWLRDVASVSASYEFSETQRKKLAQIYSYTRLRAGHDGIPVPQMIRICKRYYMDMSEDDAEFVLMLHRTRARTLRIRQLRRLVGLFETAGELIEAA